MHNMHNHPARSVNNLAHSVKTIAPALSLALLPLAMLAPTPARADLDGISTVIGSGQDANMMAVGMVWDWNKQWLKSGDWSLGGYWEADVSLWQGKGDGPSTIAGAGFTPVFRYGPTARKVAPYLEAGIGTHVFSRVQLNDEKRMGTAFEFGDLAGVGLRFGKDLRHEIGYRFQHYSNGGISDNNGGVNFHQIRFRYGF